MAFAQQSLSSQSGGSLTDVLWMFGGISSAQPVNYSAELWGYTASSRSWSLDATTNNRPPALVGSTMCSIGHFLYLYGGANFDANAFDHLYAFDTSRRTWSLVLLGGFLPPARAHHAMSCAGGRVYVHGGQDTHSTVQSELYALSDLNTLSTAWTVPLQTGNPPTARKGHSLTHGRTGKLYCFGGSGASGEKLADAYSYDPTIGSWEALATIGDAPAGREGHTATILDEKLYIFGGADGFGNLNDVRVLDLGILRWSHPRASGTPPAPRWGHVGAVISQTLYLYGGLSGSSELLSDMWTMSRHCIGHLELTASRARFVSGEGAYRALSTCSWHLNPVAAHRQVRLFFSSFGFEQGHDYVTVYDGPTTNHPRLARLTGDTLPQPIVSTSGSLLVVMATDATTSDSASAAPPHDACRARVCAMLWGSTCCDTVSSSTCVAAWRVRVCSRLRGVVLRRVRGRLPPHRRPRWRRERELRAVPRRRVCECPRPRGVHALRPIQVPAGQWLVVLPRMPRRDPRALHRRHVRRRLCLLPGLLLCDKRHEQRVRRVPLWRHLPGRRRRCARQARLLPQYYYPELHAVLRPEPVPGRRVSRVPDGRVCHGYGRH